MQYVLPLGFLFYFVFCLFLFPHSVFVLQVTSLAGRCINFLTLVQMNKKNIDAMFFALALFVSVRGDVLVRDQIALETLMNIWPVFSILAAPYAACFSFRMHLLV